MSSLGTQDQSPLSLIKRPAFQSVLSSPYRQSTTRKVLKYRNLEHRQLSSSLDAIDEGFHRLHKTLQQVAANIHEIVTFRPRSYWKNQKKKGSLPLSPGSLSDDENLDENSSLSRSVNENNEKLLRKANHLLNSSCWRQNLRSKAKARTFYFKQLKRLQRKNWTLSKPQRWKYLQSFCARKLSFHRLLQKKGWKASSPDPTCALWNCPRMFRRSRAYHLLRIYKRARLTSSPSMESDCSTRSRSPLFPEKVGFDSKSDIE